MKIGEFTSKIKNLSFDFQGRYVYSAPLAGLDFLNVTNPTLPSHKIPLTPVEMKIMELIETLKGVPLYK